MRGSEFATKYARASQDARERAALEWASTHGDLRDAPIEVSFGPFTGILRVTEHYFWVGEGLDWLFLPLSGQAAQAVADAYGMLLPTRRIVDAIWRQSPVHASPTRISPNDGSFAQMVLHNEHVQKELTHRDPGWPHQLIAGIKKDVVLSNKCGPGRVAIYGWHELDGVPIQPLNTTSHSDLYVDYSHGVRLVASMMTVNGSEIAVKDVLQSPEMSGLLSDEGPLRVLRYPQPARLTEEKPMLRKGSRGVDVEIWQRFLNAQGFRDQDGLRLKEDGDFGGRTEFATKEFQKARGLTPDGIVGALTLAIAAELGLGRESTDPPPAPSNKMPFVQAKNYTPANRTKIDLIVIHTMEYPERWSAAEDVANWFADKQAPKYPAPRASAHFNVDGNSVVQSVLEKDIAWHAPGANHNGIGIEHAGYARQSPKEWADDFSVATLERSARLVADLCMHWGIPTVRLTATDLRDGKRGICGHVDCTDAFSGGKGHTDPGPSYPWVWYLEKIRANMGG